MNRGDVVRVQLPRPAGSPGREQFGTRPAVIVDSQSEKANLQTIVVVPMTSNLSAMRFPGSFQVFSSALNGRSVDSVVLTHQVRAIDKNRIEATLGRLSDTDMRRLEGHLRELLDL